VPQPTTLPRAPETEEHKEENRRRQQRKEETRKCKRKCKEEEKNIRLEEERKAPREKSYVLAKL
jgi:hypothetical protein